MSVKENLLKIKNDLPGDVTLVAVSKTKPKELILEAYEAGQRDFGENYVQELVDKHAQLPNDIHWHFIGHLQSNKVKYLAPFVEMVHGVDSLKLLQEINKQALKNKRTVNCLLQLYIAEEETKFGLSFRECGELLRSEIFSELKNIHIKGFMAMASNTDHEEQIRKEFRSVKEFAGKLSAELSAGNAQLTTIDYQFPVLSYGMSSDYKIAVEEGSTMVRIGSTIFGERVYS